MYKSAVIIVLLVGTACAHPPTNTLRKSVAEDSWFNRFSTGSKVPPQGSEVENQEKDLAPQEFIKELTPVVPIPLPQTETTSSDENTQEDEEIKTFCAQNPLICAIPDETKSRQKRNPESFTLDQIPDFSTGNVKVIKIDGDMSNFQGINIPAEFGNFDFSNLQLDNAKIFEMPNQPGIQISNIPNMPQILNLPDFTIPDISQIDSSQIKIIGGLDNLNLDELNLPFDISQVTGGATVIIAGMDGQVDLSSVSNAAPKANDEEVEKLKKEVETLKKNVEDAKEDLALKSRTITESNEKIKKLEDDLAKKEKECETQQEKHDASAKVLLGQVDDLKAKLNEQSNNFTETVNGGKQFCEKALEDNKKTTKAELETLKKEHDAEVKSLTEKIEVGRLAAEETSKACNEALENYNKTQTKIIEELKKENDAVTKTLTEELVDLRERFDKQSKNCTTTQEEKNVCEKTLKDNKEREEREREAEKLQCEAAIESKDEQLAKEKQFSDKLVAEVTRLTDKVNGIAVTEKERCDNTLKEHGERAEKDFDELEKDCEAKKAEKDKNVATLQDLLQKCRENTIKN